MQMTPHYWQLFVSQQADLLLLHPLTGIWQEWSNHWWMILNPNKTQAFVVSRSRTVRPPHGDLVLSEVSIQANPNLYFLGVKMTENSPLKTMCMVLFHVSLREFVFLRLDKCIILWTPLCYCFGILHLFSKSLSIVLPRGGQLLNVTFRFLTARCIRWPGLVQIRVSSRCVIDVVRLGLVYIVQG